jgi:hypothetical protein
LTTEELIMKQKHPLPLHSYVFVIFAYKKVSSTTLSLWPQKSSQERIERKILFADIIQAETAEKALGEGMQNYQQYVMPHLHDRPAPIGAWRQHLSKYKDNFYTDVIRIHDHEIREDSAAMIREWTRHVQEGLLENKLLIDKLMHSHP